MSSQPAFAQDASAACELDSAGRPDEDCAEGQAPDGVMDNDPVADLPQTSADGSSGDAIVVTGSCVRLDTFSSISPLQFLRTEASRDVREFGAAHILQGSEAAAGQQIDATFQGFALDNGPGSQTLNLRGLGADRRATVAGVQTLLKDRKIVLDLTDAAKRWLGSVGYDPVYGARPLKRAVQRYLQDPLAEMILEGQVPDGSTLNIDEGDGALVMVAA